MPRKSSRKSSARVVARTVSKRSKTPSVLSLAFWKTPRMILVVVLVALLGGYLLYKSFALTNTVTYSGSFTKKKSSVSYTVNATADGTLTAVASYTNTNGFKMSLLANDGHSLTAALSGVNPQTMTVPVTKGTYTLILNGSPASKGSGSYTVAVSYPVADTVPPVAAITSPASGTTIKGLTNLEGTATDNDGVAKVEVSVDSGAFAPTNLSGASTTSQAWSYLLDTTKLSNASHNVVVKVTDLTGNTATATATYTINNAVLVTDTTPPTVQFSSPSGGSLLSDVTTFTGTASDDTSVAKVEYSVDNAATWSLASGTTNWSFNVDTTTLSNASHTFSVRASDSSGNIGTTSGTWAVSNATYPRTAPTTQGTWVSPERVTINVNTVNTYLNTGQLWTIADVYKLLLANARDLDVIGPHYTINVQDTYASMTTVSYSVSQTGTYSNWSGTSWLKASPSTFANMPDYVFTHEFGHAWAQYWWAMYHQADWSPYTAMRLDGTTYNGVTYQYLGQDPRLNTSQTWDEREIIADDYRLLFGSAKAISERPYNINSVIVDPRNQPGLMDWLLNTWR